MIHSDLAEKKLIEVTKSLNNEAMVMKIVFLCVHDCKFSNLVM